MSTSNDEQVDQQEIDYNNMCAICLCPRTNKSQLICGHAFCYQCIVEWCKVKLECPFCRQPFNSFVTYNIPRDSLRVESQTGRYYNYDLSNFSSGILPLVLNIVIDTESVVLIDFLSNSSEFVNQINEAHGTQMVDKMLSFTFLNASDDQNYQSVLIESVRRASQTGF